MDSLLFNRYRSIFYYQRSPSSKFYHQIQGSRINLLKWCTTALWQPHYNSLDLLDIQRIFRDARLIRSFTKLDDFALFMIFSENPLVSGNAGDEKNLHPGGRIFSFNRFSSNFLLCFFFAFFAICLLKWKIYILIHIRLSGRVSNKKIFTRSVSGNKITVFFFFLPYISLTYNSKVNKKLVII